MSILEEGFRFKPEGEGYMGKRLADGKQSMPNLLNNPSVTMLMTASFRGRIIVGRIPGGNSCAH